MNDEVLNSMSLSEQQLYARVWLGKHISASYYLRNAVRSSLGDAIRSSSLWLNNCKNAKTKCNSLSERVHIANINYSLMLPGPVLSTILLSATSIEAFLRHCYVAVLRKKAPRIGHATFLNRIGDFNKKWPTDKIQDIILQVNADRLPSSLETEIKDLFSFRNDVVHSDPIYHSPSFLKPVRIKPDRSKKMVEREPRPYKYYADLTSGNRPLLLVHAILATTTHDKTVRHITSTAKAIDILHFMNEVDMTNDDFGLIWVGLVPGISYNTAKEISKEMTSMNKELNAVSIKEMTAFLKAIRPQNKNGRT